MNPRGEDVANAVRVWSTDAIQKASANAYDLGKFCFTVSSGTIGFLATVEKLGSSPSFDPPLLASLLLCFLAVIVSLVIVLPRIVSLNGGDNLYDSYERFVKDTQRKILAWFVIWLLGLMAGIYAVA